MIHIDQLIQDFSSLGDDFRKVSGEAELKAEAEPSNCAVLTDSIENGFYHNPWFIPSFVRFALKAWAEALQQQKVERWLHHYLPGLEQKKEPASVGIIMAGNIPMVGLHDLLCVLASGNKALIKLSSSDNILVPAIIKALCQINPEYKEQISFVEGPLKNFDAIVATGSNNSSRYFDYYFGKYPHIIRKNRNGVAVITGEEKEDELKRLADDIFIYFGLGCRNVSKLYLPEGYRMEELFPWFSEYDFLADMHKYRNNYDYQKSILLINRVEHLDNGFLLVKNDASLLSAISVLHTESYQSIEQLNRHLQENKENIQCIVSSDQEVKSAIPLGRSQFPELWDYADGVDTLRFLIDSGKNI